MQTMTRRLGAVTESYIVIDPAVIMQQVLAEQQQQQQTTNPDTLADLGLRYRTDPKFRLNWLSYTDKQRKADPASFAANMRKINAQVGSDPAYRVWMREDLLSMWSTHPELAKATYRHLPKLYAVGSHANNLGNYKSNTGYRRWYRARLLNLAESNWSSFISALGTDNARLGTDTNFRTWYQKDIVSMRNNHYADLAGHMTKALPNLYRQTENNALAELAKHISEKCTTGYHNLFRDKAGKLLWVTDKLAAGMREHPDFTFIRRQSPCTATKVADATKIPPSTQSVVSAATASDTTCVNCQPTIEESVLQTPITSITKTTQALDETGTEVVDTTSVTPTFTLNKGIVFASVAVLAGVGLLFTLRR